MSITTSMIKDLRDATMVLLIVKKLEQTNGDFDEAIKILREKRCCCCS